MDQSEQAGEKVEKKEIKHTVGLPLEWALQKVLGPTLEEFGKDIRKLYEKGRDRIVNNAARKIKAGTESQPANMKVAWETLTSGVFADSEIASEYFGGVLASSKSLDGKDDRGVYYLDIIKSLSSSQLHLHYCLYRSVNHMLSRDKKNQSLNLGRQNELSSNKLYFLPLEFTQLGLNIDTDFNALYAEGLINNWEINTGTFADPRNPNTQMAAMYGYFIPTTLGFQLYAVAHNRLLEWRRLTSTVFEDFPDIKYPSLFDFNMRNILARSFNKNVYEIEVNKPVQDLFAFTINPHNTPKWVDSIKEEQTNEEPIKVGTVYRNTMDGNNWSEYICLTFKENESFVLKRVNSSYTVEYRYIPISETKSKLIYSEWTEKEQLEDLLDISSLQKLKNVLEKTN